MKKVLVIVVIILSIFLFIGSPDINDNRIFKQIWESGHFILFACIVFIALQFPQLKEASLFPLLLGIAVFSCSLGLFTEVIQSLVGRSFEIKDLVNDLLGAYTALLIDKLGRKNKIRVNFSIIFAILILIIAGFQTLIVSVVDQWRVDKDFPVLSDFETDFELSRWDYNRANLSLSSDQKRSGNNAMKVEFLPGKYPDITLLYFKRDWRHYKKIQFSLFNGTNEPLEINLKITDIKHHHSGYNYSDRFNHEFSIQPGWNDMNFSLNQIRLSPKTREMEMQSMRSLSLFMIDVKYPTVIYIDDVHLNQN